MRRIIAAVLILALPSALALIGYFWLKSNRRVPTDVNAIGKVLILAGSGAPGTQDGVLTEATFSDPFGIAIDHRGNIIVSDGGDGNRIRRVTPNGRVETIAGSVEGFADDDALAASFNTPSGIAIAKDGAIIICDTSNNRIRRLDVNGRVSTIAGNGVAGRRDGPGMEAEFDGPTSVALDKKGNIFVADTYNDCVRKIGADGQVTTVAGTGSPGYRDGRGPEALFDTPCGLAIDDENNTFVADSANHAIRKITTAGDVVTVASGRFPTETPAIHSDEQQALIERPIALALTYDGFLFVTDDAGGRIIRVDPQSGTATYAGGRNGFADGTGQNAKFRSPAGIAVDRRGNLIVADSQNYLIRLVTPTIRNEELESQGDNDAQLFVQPASEIPVPDPGSDIPRLSEKLRSVGTLPWPLSPQDRWHEISGVFCEARGAPGGIALDHLHSGVDVKGRMGESALAVLDEKASSILPNWDYQAPSEGIHLSIMSYIHVRIGRSEKGKIEALEKFKPRLGENGELAGIRVRRGARFRVGDFIGSLNSLNHAHLNVGSADAEVNPLRLGFPNFSDAVPPTIEAGGIEIQDSTGNAIRATEKKRLLLSGDVRIVVTGYDKVDGNTPSRKLGLYKLGYQLLKADGTNAFGFEQPFYNLEFDRMIPGPSRVRMVYAAGSGVSAYGTPTRFRYILTNYVKGGIALAGILRTGRLEPGDYTLKVLAEDLAGNKASGEHCDLPITVKHAIN